MELILNGRTKWRYSRLRSLMAIVLMNLFVLSVYGQKVPISGTVTSGADGNTLIGVTVRLKGTTTGTVTNTEGVYSLEAETGQTLVFSYMGFKTMEVEIKGEKMIHVTLEEDVRAIEEVVVIGYGTVKRKDVTGAVSSVNSDDIRQSQPVTIEQALQGRIPGMVVQQTSGQPGGGVSVQIRGITGFSGSNPLYVLDGVELQGIASVGGGTNPLAGINPSDIESIDVLKDASATAIYGSKGTDGVIIITTKRGGITPPKIAYEFSAGIQQLTEKLPVMNLQEFATFVNAVRSTGGRNTYRTLVIQGSSEMLNVNDFPTDPIPERIMYEEHNYTPFQFTALGEDVSWGRMFYYWGTGHHSLMEPDRNATWGGEDAHDQYFQRIKEKFVDKGIPVLMGEYGAYRRATPQDLVTHNDAVDYWITYVTRKALMSGIKPFFWDTGGAIDRYNHTVRDQRTIDAIIAATK
jgi:TonB-dependent SusC/RagA subfamily outer membrane receptor